MARDKEYCKEIVEKFLTFAEEKEITLGGYVIYGWALEHQEYRPMHKDDYPGLIRDFLKSLGEEENGKK